MLVIGLTGGIASGKSAVSDRFRALGVPIVDTDLLAREVVEPGTQGLARLVSAFGDSILQADGRLDRAALRRRVFSDPASRDMLDQLLHPLIRELCRQRLATFDSPYAILVVPLLVETDFVELVDRVLVVDTPEAQQIERLQRRDGCSRSEARAMLDAQAPRERRLRAANDILCNNGGLEALDRQIRDLHQQYLALAGAGSSPTDDCGRTGPN
ncbi:dephospho-CoA kinase [Methylonatrum kenyense]|uniref:dephospho-CoA kinase n=1 Tax=Methylonatrum kenyense TaxID=455253 RepID=UPI00200A8FC8|nr:dephospho-CoA kinase [Methylonatrum kenyense]MCK8516305.1 dephospho-CoA kinase [Methylonatrum kenyense]